MAEQPTAEAEKDAAGRERRMRIEPVVGIWADRYEKTTDEIMKELRGDD